MGRPRGFDRDAVIRAAAGVFARRSFDAVSIDDLVTELGLHRNSLYQAFGSKRGLYLAALRWHLAEQVEPLAGALAASSDLASALARATDPAGGSALDLLLMAALERAPTDGDVAEAVHQALAGLDAALDGLAARSAVAGPLGLPRTVTATVLGLRLRSRAGPA